MNSGAIIGISITAVVVVIAAIALGLWLGAFKDKDDSSQSPEFVRRGMAELGNSIKLIDVELAWYVLDELDQKPSLYEAGYLVKFIHHHIIKQQYYHLDLLITFLTH